MLFSPQGIALSGYRYNIGGGGVGVTTPTRAPKEEPPTRAGLTFLRAANDAHVPDPDRLRQQRTAAVHDEREVVRRQPRSRAAKLRTRSTSPTSSQRLHDDDHITLQYVSPMNEPDNSFGDCGQEGMQVPVAQRALVVQALGTALARHAPYAKVIADETTADAILADEAPQWLAVPGTSRYVAAIAHHTYDFPNDALRKLLPPIATALRRCRHG